MNTELDTEAFNCEGTEVCVLPVSARHSVDRDYQFSVSEIRLYELASRFCWTDSETKEVLRLLKDPSFDPRQIGSDIDTRVSTLLTCFLFSYSFVVFFKKLVFIRNYSQNLKLVFLHLDKVDRALACSRLYSINLHKPGDGNQDLVFIMSKHFSVNFDVPLQILDKICTN